MDCADENEVTRAVYWSAKHGTTIMVSNSAKAVGLCVSATSPLKGKLQAVGRDVLSPKSRGRKSTAETLSPGAIRLVSEKHI
jgi:hypothetical protein